MVLLSNLESKYIQRYHESPQQICKNAKRRRKMQKKLVTTPESLLIVPLHLLLKITFLPVPQSHIAPLPFSIKMHVRVVWQEIAPT